MVIVCGIIINAFFRIAAGSINRCLVFAVPQAVASPLLVDTPQYMEKLADAFRFRIPADGIHFNKGGTDKPGLGRQIPREPDCPHAKAACFKLELVGKKVFRRFWR